MLAASGILYFCAVFFPDDWRADGYRWRQGGSNKVTCAGVVIHKRYFQVYSAANSWSTKFRRTSYTRDDCQNVVLITYEGDASQAIDVPHGNAKHARATSRPFVRTQPHVLHDIQDQASTSSGPRSLYREMVSAQPNGQRQEVPRNVEQVCINFSLSQGNITRHYIYIFIQQKW